MDNNLKLKHDMIEKNWELHKDGTPIDKPIDLIVEPFKKTDTTITVDIQTPRTLIKRDVDITRIENVYKVEGDQSELYGDEYHMVIMKSYFLELNKYKQGDPIIEDMDDSNSFCD